jgi:hypothetical protein
MASLMALSASFWPPTFSYGKFLLTRPDFLELAVVLEYNRRFTKPLLQNLQCRCFELLRITPIA